MIEKEFKQETLPLYDRKGIQAQNQQHKIASSAQNQQHKISVSFAQYSCLVSHGLHKIRNTKSALVLRRIPVLYRIPCL